MEDPQDNHRNNIASIFLTQASGEYEDKLSKSELTLITKEPEKELRETLNKSALPK